MSGGQIWRRPDGLRWVEVQAAAVDPSGWRLMVPPPWPWMTPPTLRPWSSPWTGSGRVHLLCGAPHEELGEPVVELSVEDVWILQAAVQRLVAA